MKRRFFGVNGVSKEILVLPRVLVQKLDASTNVRREGQCLYLEMRKNNEGSRLQRTP